MAVEELRWFMTPKRNKKPLKLSGFRLNCLR
jgi:hypothetical protein